MPNSGRMPSCQSRSDLCKREGRARRRPGALRDVREQLFAATERVPAAGRAERVS